MINENIIDREENLSMECQNLNINNTNLLSGAHQIETNEPHINDTALRMMQKMGYKKGSGLGKSEQGITKNLDVRYQLGKKGLGSKLRNIEDVMEKWNFSLEDVAVKEELHWLINNHIVDCTEEEMITWIKEGQPINDVKSECRFCDQEILHNVIDAKNIFDEMDNQELCQARAKSNPFETIRSVFFMNRAALKMANIDAATDFMFTDIDENGFSVEGKENFQEILSKHIYICQCLVALEIVRSHGHFVTKLFDVFTPFSVGLLFLIYKCFEKVSIFKPNSSRPANSERYFICSNLKRDSFYEKVKKFLWLIVNRLWEIKDDKDVDILEIVPLNLLKNDQCFYSYIVKCNENLALKQTVALRKLATFCRNPTLIEFRQDELRKKCLELWKIPDKPKTTPSPISAHELINSTIEKIEIISVQPRKVDHIQAFNKLISDIEDWYYFPLYSSQKTNNCNFYTGTNGKVYRFQKGKWIKIKNIQLCNGTVVYAEFVNEKCVTRVNGNKRSENTRYSLHIIDGLRLGERNLADLTFSQRRELLENYCKSVNKESQPQTIRIRMKIMDHLNNITSNCLICQSKDDGTYSNLPLLGYNSLSETFSVNSLLLLKVNSSQFFQCAFVLRVAIFITNNDENNENSLLLEDIISEIKRKT
ncbi:cap-specific mRNA (nucleoside-2'-O-)-methyltransferase 1 isoform X4 [Diorhabda carinulata]|uniref:cap-specific mRNA (nucleoside-2'-O-)-methyltransferase 1 isoform X4 n=1 Tax=Diorhabda carinulata TaxID=1163345 RepID=UPI0025A07B5F|nr:cap-specific mRNA (nucleoside-2'-O-)-methyltransferase 1 isoform X4 [Diorhabda carinulata]